MATDDRILLNLVLNEATVSAVEGRVRNLVNRLNNQNISLNINGRNLDNIVNRLNDIQQRMQMINSTPVNINANLTSAQQQYRLETERLRVTQQLELSRQRTLQTENQAISALAQQNRTLNINNNVTHQIEQGARNIGNNMNVAGGHARDFVDYLSDGVRYLVVYRSLYEIMNQIGEAFSETKNVDKELISVRKTTGMAENEIEKIRKSSYGVATEYGRTASEYLGSVSEFARGGYKELSTELAKVSLLTQNVGDVSADSANKMLLAVDAAYKLNGDVAELTDVVNGLNNIANLNPTSMQKMADGMQVSASMAKVAGLEISDLVALIGTGTAVTQREGGEIARAIRTILMNIRAQKGELEDGTVIDDDSIAKAEAALKGVGIATKEVVNGVRELRDPMNILDELAGKWSTLNTEAQSIVLESLANKRQANVLAAILENWDMVGKMQNEYFDSANSAVKENELYLQGWEATQKRVSAKWVEFVANMADTSLITGTLNALYGVLVALDTPIGRIATSIILVNTALALTGRLWQAIRARSIVADILSMGVAERNLGTAIQLVAGHLGRQALAWVRSPFGMAAIAVAGITLITSAIEKNSQKLEENSKKTGEALDKVKSNIEELDDLTKQYNELQISGEWDNTPVETKKQLQEDINKLLGDEADKIDIINGKYKETTEELFKQRMTKLPEEEKAAFDNVQAKGKTLWDSVYWNGGIGGGGYNYGTAQATEEEKKFIEKYDKIFDVKHSSVGRGMSASDYAVNFDNFDDFMAKYEDIKNMLQDMYNEGMGESELYKGLNSFIAKFDTKVTEYKTAVEELEQTKAGQKLVDYINQNVGGYIDNLDEYKRVVEWIEKNFTDNDKDKALSFLNSYFSEYSSNIDNAANSIESYKAKLKSLNEALDNIQSAYDAVSSAIEEYNENGYMSVDTYQKLLELAPEYMAMLIDENGNLTLTKDSWKLLTEAKIRDMYQTQANQYIESLKAAADSGNIDKLDELTQGYKNLSAAKIIDYKATLATLNLTDEQRAGAEAYLAGLEKAMNQTIAGLGKGGMGGSKSKKSAKDQEKQRSEKAKQIREKEKQIEEAWEKERLEQLKDDLEKRKNEIEKYKSYIETLDFGLDIVDENDYSGQVDLLSQKYGNLVTYGQQLREEFTRVSQIVPKTADEAKEIASRIQEIGSEMRNNVKSLRETYVEMQKIRIEALKVSTIDVTNGIMDGLDRALWSLEQFENPFNRNSKFIENVASFESIFDSFDELDKELEKRKRHDQTLIAEEQATQDTINEIVTKSLEMQAEENAKARAEERAKLEEELEEISKEYKDTLDTASTNTKTAQEAISSAFDGISNSAQSMQEGVSSEFKTMANNVSDSVDSMLLAVEKWKEEKSKYSNFEDKKFYDMPDTWLKDKNGDITPKSIASSIVPEYTRVSSSYGMRKHPKTGEWKHHDGYDYAAPLGSPIKAAASGIVTLAGVNGGYGNCVIIKHSDGTSTLYGHASELLVKKGAEVSAGQIIAKVGSTGNSTGNHLHFEARNKDGKTVDSWSWGIDHAVKTYAKGTKDFGIAGENNKKEYAINKKTGEWSVIDSPTLFDKKEYDIVGEKVSEKIDKKLPVYATGTPMTNQTWLGYVKEACDAFGIPYNIALSLIDQESGNGTASDTWKFNSAGAYGLTQVTKSALDDLYENNTVSNKIREILNKNGVDMGKSRGAGAEYARDNIWVGIGNLAEIKERYMKGNDPDFRKSLGYYYAGGNYAGENGTWYANQVINRANSEAFIEAANNLAGGIATNTNAINENTESTDKNTKVVDTNPFSSANIDNTIKEIKNIGKEEKEKVDAYLNSKSIALMSDRLNSKYSEINYLKEQQGLIYKVLNEEDDFKGLYMLLEESRNKWDEYINKYIETAGDDFDSSVVDALESAAQEEYDSFQKIINNFSSQLEDLANQMAEKAIETYKKHWARDTEAFDRESNDRWKEIEKLNDMLSLTNDSQAVAIISNRLRKLYADEADYQKANISAKEADNRNLISDLDTFASDWFLKMRQDYNSNLEKSVDVSKLNQSMKDAGMSDEDIKKFLSQYNTVKLDSDTIDALTEEGANTDAEQVPIDATNTILTTLKDEGIPIGGVNSTISGTLKEDDNTDDYPNSNIVLSADDWDFLKQQGVDVGQYINSFVDFFDREDVKYFMEHFYDVPKRIEDWVTPDGEITAQFELDMNDASFLLGEDFVTMVEGYVDGIANYQKSISESIAQQKQSTQAMFEDDNRRIENFKSSMESAIDAYVKVREEQKEVLNEQITYYNSLNTLLSKHYSVINAISDEEYNIVKQLKAAQTSYKYLDAQTRKLLFNEEDYVALSNELNSIKEKANRLQREYHSALKSASKEELEEMTNSFERQYELLMKQYEVSKAKLEVDKKLTQLNNVLNERNVKMFINGQWQWVANMQDVINAQNEVEDAKQSLADAKTQKYQTEETNKLSAKADDLSTQINFLDSQIDKINEDWGKITDILEGNAMTVSQSWSDMAKTSSEYLQNIIGNIGSAFAPLYEVLTGNEIPPMEYYAGYENSIEPEKGFDKGYVKADRDESYARTTPSGYNIDNYPAWKKAKFTDASILDYKNDDKYVPKGFLTSLDLSTLNPVLNLEKLSNVPDFTNNKKDSVVTYDNRVMINGVELTKQDSESMQSIIKRYTGNH